MFQFLFSFLALVLFLAAAPVLAQTSIDARGDVGGSGIPGGSIMPGADTDACNSGKAGAIRYNSATSCAEFCDGTAWTCPNSGGGCTAPASCPNVGDTCADGSEFAGFNVVGATCYRLYAAAADESGGPFLWGLNAATFADSFVNGKANHDWIVANTILSQYPAFQACENATAHSQTDWYLPSIIELSKLYENAAAIGGFNMSTRYWSSTEYENSNADAWRLNFAAPNIINDAKDTDTWPVRCVRRD